MTSRRGIAQAPAIILRKFEIRPGTAASGRGFQPGVHEDKLIRLRLLYSKIPIRHTPIRCFVDVRNFLVHRVCEARSSFNTPLLPERRGCARDATKKPGISHLYVGIGSSAIYLGVITSFPIEHDRDRASVCWRGYCRDVGYIFSSSSQSDITELVLGPSFDSSTRDQAQGMVTRQH